MIPSKHLSIVTSGVLLSTSMFANSVAFGNGFSPIQKAALVTLGTCAAGSVTGALSASKDKLLDPTWTTLGYTGMGCLLSIPLNWALSYYWDDTSSDKDQTIAQQAKTISDLNLQLTQAQHEKEKLRLAPSAGPYYEPNEFLAMTEGLEHTILDLKELQVEADRFGLDLSECKIAHRFFLNPDKVVDLRQGALVQADEYRLLVNYQWVTFQDKCIRNKKKPNLTQFIPGLSLFLKRAEDTAVNRQRKARD